MSPRDTVIFAQQPEETPPAGLRQPHPPVSSLRGHAIGDDRLEGKHDGGERVQPAHGGHQRVLRDQQAGQRRRKAGHQIGNVNPGIDLHQLILFRILHQQAGPRVHGHAPDAVGDPCRQKPPETLGEGPEDRRHAPREDVEDQRRARRPTLSVMAPLSSAQST